MKCTRFFCTWSLSLCHSLRVLCSLKSRRSTTILRQKNNNSIFMREQALAFLCVACLCTQCFAVGCFSIPVFKSLHGVYRRPEQHTAAFYFAQAFFLSGFLLLLFSWFVYFKLMFSFCFLCVSLIKYAF